MGALSLNAVGLTFAVRLRSIGRVSVITTAAWAPVNSFSGLTQTQLFQTEFILDEENHNKLIESVNFNRML